MDLDGFINEFKTNKLWQLALIFLICIIGYYIIRSKMKNNFSNVIIYGNPMNEEHIKTIGEELINDMIKLPQIANYAPCVDSVCPAGAPKEEDRRIARMEVLNMFYTSKGDDEIDISNRPQNLYIIP